MANERLKNTAINAAYSYLYQLLYMAIGVVSRLIFVRYLGRDYLGVNGLFSNILGVLSISELGVGTAIGFALYKPLAQNDKEKIKSIMALFRKAYFAIGSFIAVAGLILVPFLPYIIKNTTGIENLSLYYILYLINTVSGYFLSYKTTLLTSDQKEYMLKKTQMIGTLAIALVQMLVLAATRNYLLYLLSDVLIRLVMQVVMQRTADRQYPFLKKEKAEKLPRQDVQVIVRNVKALMIHNLGEVSVSQTDNLIISGFISLEMTGIVSNYVMFTTYANLFIVTALSAAIPSVGNLIAKESDEAKLAFFKTYRLLAYWLYGWMSLGFIYLSTPLVKLVFGADYVLAQSAVVLMGLVFFLRGEGSAIYNYKIAAGIYNEDKYLAFIGGIINLIASVVAVKYLGVAGVYLGTVIYSLFVVVARDIIIYRRAFGKRWLSVLSGTVRYVLFFGLSAFACSSLLHFIPEMGWGGFGIKLAILVVVPNAVLFLLEGRSPEFRYYLSIAGQTIAKLLGRK